LPKPNAQPVSAALFQLLVRESHAKNSAKMTSSIQPPCGVGAKENVFAAPSTAATR
jgi:hypothetical protein